MKLKATGQLPVTRALWNEWADRASAAWTSEDGVDKDFRSHIMELNSGTEVITLHSCAFHENVENTEAPYIHCVATDVGIVKLMNIVHRVNLWEIQHMGYAATELEISMFQNSDNEWYKDATIRGPWFEDDFIVAGKVKFWRAELLRQIQADPFI